MMLATKEKPLNPCSELIFVLQRVWRSDSTVYQEWEYETLESAVRGSYIIARNDPDPSNEMRFAIHTLQKYSFDVHKDLENE